jgi:ribonuclease HI
VGELLFIWKRVRTLTGEGNQFIIYFDGASKGNPGHSGVGAIVFKKHEIFTVLTKYIGIATNNVAEYTALKAILMKVQPVIVNKKEVEMLLRGDSELVVKQLRGFYRIKNVRLKGLCETVVKMLERYKSWNIEYIPREENKIADALATSALENALRALKAEKSK